MFTRAGEKHIERMLAQQHASFGEENMVVSRERRIALRKWRAREGEARVALRCVPRRGDGLHGAIGSESEQSFEAREQLLAKMLHGPGRETRRDRIEDHEHEGHRKVCRFDVRLDRLPVAGLQRVEAANPILVAKRVDLMRRALVGVAADAVAKNPPPDRREDDPARVVARRPERPPQQHKARLLPREPCLRRRHAPAGQWRGPRGRSGSPALAGGSCANCMKSPKLSASEGFIAKVLPQKEPSCPMRRLSLEGSRLRWFSAVGFSMLARSGCE